MSYWHVHSNHEPEHGRPKTSRWAGGIVQSLERCHDCQSPFLDGQRLVFRMDIEDGTRFLAAVHQECRE